MRKNVLQTEIKALQEYRNEAESLIEKINSTTEKMESDITINIERIKKQIAEDLNEMVSYVSPDIYATLNIPLGDFVERDEEGNHPLANFFINFERRICSMDSDTGLTQYKIWIVEDCYSFSSTIYANGHWANEYPNVASERNYGQGKNIQTIIEILCRNWDSILEGAYQKIKEAYQKDTDTKLLETRQKNTEVQVRLSRLNSSAN